MYPGAHICRSELRTPRLEIYHLPCTRNLLDLDLFLCCKTVPSSNGNLNFLAQHLENSHVCHSIWKKKIQCNEKEFISNTATVTDTGTAKIYAKMRELCPFKTCQIVNCPQKYAQTHQCRKSPFNSNVAILTRCYTPLWLTAFLARVLSILLQEAKRFTLWRYLTLSLLPKVNVAACQLWNKRRIEHKTVSVKLNTFSVLAMHCACIHYTRKSHDQSYWEWQKVRAQSSSFYTATHFRSATCVSVENMSVEKVHWPAESKIMFLESISFSNEHVRTLAPARENV